jgi:hypothetical protein
MSARRWTRLLGLTLVVGALASCSDDPSGPGTVTLTVRGSVPLGAAVVELRGAGVQGVRPLASGWVVVDRVAGEAGEVRRLAIVQTQPGTLSVEVDLADLGADFPSLTVLGASDANDLPRPSLGGVRASFQR